MKSIIDPSTIQTCGVHSDAAIKEKQEADKLAEEGFLVSRNYNNCSCKMIKNRKKENKNMKSVLLKSDDWMAIYTDGVLIAQDHMLKLHSFIKDGQMNVDFKTYETYYADENGQFPEYLQEVFDWHEDNPDFTLDEIKE